MFLPLPPWKESPFLRLLFPLILGVLFQFYLPLSVFLIGCLMLFSIAILLTFNFTSLFAVFRFHWLSGVAVNFTLFFLGCFLTENKDIQLEPDFIGKHATGERIELVVRIDEPPVEKRSSYKAISTVKYFLNNNSIEKVKGKLILYFRKDSIVSRVREGSTLVLRTVLQEIRSGGNPGAFDFKKYSAFQGIHHQTFLRKEDYFVQQGNSSIYLPGILFQIREKIIRILKENIPGSRESGLAEALLIGYKEDLDKGLTQAYTDTGVVHVIAISGLHLGIIYWLLLLFSKLIDRKKRFKWMNSILMIAGLWGFSLLAGAGPSVVRSAFMFSLMILARGSERSSFIINTISASAFALICYNPYWLWDVGFQLSYSAVLSIVLFFKPIYHRFYFQNKILDAIWKISALTIAAQILTLPICLYHFHQIPTYFLIANILAVPLSSLILLFEIGLCSFAFAKPLASSLGEITALLIRLLNGFIKRVSELPFAKWENLQLSIIQVIILYVAIIAISIWLSGKNRKAFLLLLFASLAFDIFRASDFYRTEQQKKILVYNIPGQTAIDFIEGRNFKFVGDSAVEENEVLKNFHLKPSRILHRTREVDNLQFFLKEDGLFNYHEKKIFIPNLESKPPNSTSSINIDLLILTGNTKTSLELMLKNVKPSVVVADASNSPWKIDSWRMICKRTGVSFYSIPDQGAFDWDIR